MLFAFLCLLVLLAQPASAAVFTVTEEQVVVGSTDGPGQTRIADGLVENMWEAPFGSPVGYVLDVRQNVSGVMGINPRLEIRGFIPSGGENFRVYAWNYSASAWNLKMASAFTARNDYHNVTLLPEEVQAGVIRLRYTDENPRDAVPGSLALDFVGVETSPPPTDELAVLLIVIGVLMGGVLAILFIFLPFPFWRRRSPEAGPDAGSKFSLRSALKSLQGRAIPVGPGIAFDLKPAHAYLVEEEKQAQSLKILEDLTSQGKHGVVITRKNPKTLNRDFHLENTQAFWLADTKMAEGSQVLTPALETILFSIEQFLKAEAQGIVLIDGIEFLVDNNNFNSVLRFLRRIIDLVSQGEHILLVSVSPGTLQERELKSLEREMDVLRLT